MVLRFKISLVFSLFLFLCSCNEKTDQDVGKKFSVKGFADSLSSCQKRKVLQEAYQKSIRISNDSLKKDMLLEISYRFLKLKDSNAFLISNREANKLAVSLKDSSGIALSYWDLAHFHHENGIEDSAYFYYNQAQKIYKRNGSDLKAAKIMLNMAIIQKNNKDYTGSEVVTAQAINLLKPLKADYQLYRAYNNLGIIFSELENYPLALKYYGNAETYLEKSRRKNLFYSLMNNIGVVYHNSGDYKKAIDHFNKGLSYDDKLLISDPKMYSMLLDNLAYAKLKSGVMVGVHEQLLKALEIRKEINHYGGITINQLHLAEFFLEKQDTLSSVKFALAAKELSERRGNMRDLLHSLRLLSVTSTNNSLAYAHRSIKLNDSLLKEERAIRDKFARIRFETDEYITETERLNQRVIRISLTTLGIIVFFILLYIIKDQKSKNKLINQKQRANEEIYNLILAQKQQFEEGREKEKQHMSRELHDGILGKLFGVRMSLDSLNDEDDAESKKKRFECVEEIQKIAEEIRLVSHKLNKTSIVDVDFRTVLEELVQKQNNEKVNFTLENDSLIDWETMENDVKINIFRIIQESISNIHKHSGATGATISIDKEVNRLLVRIADNGIGFNLKEAKKGIGLKNIQVRARSINAKVIFKSSEEGTRTEVFVPV